VVLRDETMVVRIFVYWKIVHNGFFCLFVGLWNSCWYVSN